MKRLHTVEIDVFCQNGPLLFSTNRLFYPCRELEVVIYTSYADLGRRGQKAKMAKNSTFLDLLSTKTLYQNDFFSKNIKKTMFCSYYSFFNHFLLRLTI